MRDFRLELVEIDLHRAELLADHALGAQPTERFVQRCYKRPVDDRETGCVKQAATTGSEDGKVGGWHDRKGIARSACRRRRTRSPNHMAPTLEEYIATHRLEMELAQRPLLNGRYACAGTDQPEVYTSP